MRQYLLKLKIYVPCDPEIPLFGIDPMHPHMR